MPSAVPTEAEIETITDEALLRRYAERRDPAAFAELANRRAGLVFGVCLRITANRHDAEELTQDCFLQLARKAATVQTSVAGWLHQVATHRALNAVRSRGRRRERESQAATLETETAEPAWSEIEPLLDEAVDALPNDVREAIILHFLQSLPQEAVAHRLGVHQSTVSRRIDRGLNLLRERLTASGVALSAAPLSALLAANASSPGVPNLTEAIGKIALAGAGSGSAGGLFGWLGLSWANVKAWVSLFGALAFPVLVQLAVGGWFGFLAVVFILLYVAWRRPAWFEDLAITGGARLYDNPFYPFRRWTWTTPPRNWRSFLFAALKSSAVLGGMAWIFTLGDHLVPGVIATLALYSLLALSTAARIAIRVGRFRNQEHREPAPESAEPPIDVADVVQTLCFAVLGPLMTACLTLANIRSGEPPAYTLGLFSILTFGSTWGIGDAFRKVSRYRQARLRIDGGERPEKTPEAPSKSGAIAVAVYLGLAAWQTTTSVFGATMGTPTLRLGALGYLPSLSLILLAIVIRPLIRLRETMRPALWWFAIAAAALCVVVNLGLCVVWLWPRG